MRWPLTLLTIEKNRAVLDGAITNLSILIPNLEGAKRWLRSGAFSFEATPLNVERFRAAYPEIPISDLRSSVSFVDGLKGSRRPAPKRPPYVSKTKAYPFQARAIDKGHILSASERPVYALFAEMGTGKSKVAIDLGGKLWSEGKITGIFIVCKNGPHEQWVEEQIPVHLGDMVEHRTYAWDKKKKVPKDLFKTDQLAFFTINVDALRTTRGYGEACDFIEEHKGRVLMVIDESQTIKNNRAKRTKACYALGFSCAYRMIMTGTPIAKDLTDLWSQFKFLDEAIIGHRYVTSFRGEYCRMGGFQARQVVGHKNIERFFARIEPFVFRVTKEDELDLPPKVYANHVFAMTDEQLRHYESMRDNFLIKLDSGEVSSVAIAATMLLRLQQITCGYLPIDDGEAIELDANPRLDALMEVVESRPGKRIIWARFRNDIRQIEARLHGEGRKCVTLFGETKTKERIANVKSWMDPKSGVDDLVSNPAVGGVGWNFQGECRTAIYYSNSFNAIERWQSEDRIHRIGTTGTVTYIDLICQKSPDRKILRNLKQKKDLSNFVLDDIRKLIE